MDLQKTNTSNNALSEKKKILRKVSGSVCYAIFHKFFSINQLITLYCTHSCSKINYNNENLECWLPGITMGASGAMLTFFYSSWL